MADPTQYSFELREVAELLARKAGVKSGIWQLGVNFGFAAAIMGPNDNDLKPSAVSVIQQLLLVKADKLTNLAIDAAQLEDEQTAKAK